MIRFWMQKQMEISANGGRLEEGSLSRKMRKDKEDGKKVWGKNERKDRNF